jgi:hypothetical protein
MRSTERFTAKAKSTRFRARRTKKIHPRIWPIRADDAHPSYFERVAVL